MDEHQERARRNETLFRSVNARLEDLNEAFAVTSENGLEIVCECGDGTCVEQILIPSAEYSRIRSDPTLFILLAGHEDPAAEAVVEEDQPYLVVRKPSG
jgi:hypothetical protein